MLEALKETLIREARAAETMGLCRRLSGNFSVRDAETGHICITPSALDRMTMTADDVLVLDADGTILENVNDRRPTSETPMHLAAYHARPDIAAVAHTHSPYALALAIIGAPIPPIAAEMVHIHARRSFIPIAPFAPIGSAALAESVRAPLAESDAILLARHGVLAVDGASLADAVLRAAYVEDIAAAYCRVRMLAPDAIDAAAFDIAPTLRG